MGAHLLKVGSKRRRKQADIQGQNDPEELSQTMMQEQEQRIAELEQQLSSVQIERDNNIGASTILTELVQAAQHWRCLAQVFLHPVLAQPGHRLAERQATPR